MIADQRFAADRPDVLTYKTEPLATDMTVVGPITADLYVSTTGTDADWIVKIIDVYPADAPDSESATGRTTMADYQMLVRADVMRGKFRNSFEKPEPFVPGKVTRLKFDLPDICHTFRKGHRLMVQMQSSWFPAGGSQPADLLRHRQSRRRRLPSGHAAPLPLPQPIPPASFCKPVSPAPNLSCQSCKSCNPV